MIFIALPSSRHGSRLDKLQSFVLADGPKNPFASVLASQRHFRLMKIVLQKRLILVALKLQARVLYQLHYFD
jgi:hypothetical protein